jgi:hypothetical protein
MTYVFGLDVFQSQGFSDFYMRQLGYFKEAFLLVFSLDYHCSCTYVQKIFEMVIRFSFNITVIPLNVTSYHMLDQENPFLFPYRYLVHSVNESDLLNMSQD